MILTPPMKNKWIATLKSAIDILNRLEATTPCNECEFYADHDFCEKWGKQIPVDFQQKGCNAWVERIPL